jgi:hypothetical protein
MTKSPYQPPASTVDHPPLASSFRWRRILAWTGLIYATVVLVGFLMGMTIVYWEIYGKTMEEAVVNARLVRRIAYFVVGAFLYWRFAAGVQSGRLAHVLALFVLVQLVDLAASIPFGASIQAWFDPWAMGRNLLAAGIGFVLASLGEGASSRSKRSDRVT